MTLAAIRDIAIIVLAVESFVIGLALIILLLQVRSLIRLLQDEIRPMLQSARQTVGRVKGTTTLVSDTIIGPAVRIGQFSAGLRRALTVLALGTSGKKHS
jgi:hypothetical protein